MHGARMHTAHEPELIDCLGACPSCKGDGWVLDDDLDATPCPDCGGVPTRCDDLAKHLSALVDAHRPWSLPCDVVDGLLAAAGGER